MFICSPTSQHKGTNRGNAGLFPIGSPTMCRNVVASTDFSSNGQARELIFEYQYIPGAVTWEQAFLPSTANPTPLLKESDFWSYICQLVNILKSIHDAGLCCRSVTPSKILVSPGNRIHLNCLGSLLCSPYKPLSRHHSLPPACSIQGGVSLRNQSTTHVCFLQFHCIPSWSGWHRSGSFGGGAACSDAEERQTL